uniref:cyclin-dependent kinase n=1 Tax=Dermatophagoides pteronyssinus TaxID=6956 RepID=A0A6P6XKL9_DERPT|nr:cyclin-dependent kinase 1-like [Dermatophagoides pteronyssinus]
MANKDLITEEFKYILRILNTNVDGTKKVDVALTAIKGTYGIVYRVWLEHNPTEEKAIKVFIPEILEESEGIPPTTLREINAIKSINHPNIMALDEVVIDNDWGSSNNMYLIMELCKGTFRDRMNELINVYLNSGKCKIIAWQILNAVAVCHSRGIVHRDLKPANVLWGKNDELKIADFGLARFVRNRLLSESHTIPQTGEVQTMWYRAPEVLLGDEKYGMLIDDWSVGCIIAEMFRFRMSSKYQTKTFFTD